MPYSPLLVKPMRDELKMIGVDELLTEAEVDSVLGSGEGTTLLVVNSVCGCAAGMARPGVRIALEGGVKPDRVVSVFAGQDLEATAKARSYMADIPPSSPSMGMFKGGELVWFLPRHRIEGRSADDVASDIRSAIDEHCS